MCSFDKFKEAFIETFDIEEDALNEDFTVENIKNWNSVNHMILISAIEEKFEVMLDTEDILNFTSFIEGRKILEKYDIVL
jgi:acyl carrier protein